MPKYKEKNVSRSKTVNETIDCQPENLDSTADIDDILDHIDEVLEENAEEFVRSYVQKGGQ